MTASKWSELATTLGANFAERAAAHDCEKSFVAENYAEMKKAKLFSMAVPKELGGGGASYEDVCLLLHELGRHCASTALALSMHQHLVVANVYKHKNGKPAAKMLENVAAAELVLVSTGATDWVDSNGSAERVDGGYRVSGRKVFASGVPGADLLITSIASNDEPEGPSVLHFPLSLKAEGVKVLDDWDTLGMRGTGSHTVLIEKAFVPEASIALKRPQGVWPGALDIAIGVAPAIYMAPYVGLAEEAAAMSIERARERATCFASIAAAGELENARTNVRIIWEDMIRRTKDYDFEAGLDHTNAMLSRKTLLTTAISKTMNAALELAGGAGYYKTLPLERMWRDSQAAPYHPLPERRQLEFTGRCVLGLDPIESGV